MENIWIVVIPIIMTGILSYVGNLVILRGKKAELAVAANKDNRQFSSDSERMLWAQVDRLNADIKELQKSYNALVVDNAKLVTRADQVEGLTKKVDELTKQVEGLEQQNTKLRSNNFALTQRLRALMADKEDLHRQVEVLKRQVKDMGGDQSYE